MERVEECFQQEPGDSRKMLLAPEVSLRRR
jgi:hypothetical protein